MKTQEFINIMKTKGEFVFGDYEFSTDEDFSSETVKEISCKSKTTYRNFDMGFLLENSNKIWLWLYDKDAIALYEQFLEDFSSCVETNIFGIFTDIIKKVLEVKNWNAYICNEQIKINYYYSEREPLIVYHIRVANAGFNNYILNNNYYKSKILEPINIFIDIKDTCKDCCVLNKLICLMVKQFEWKEMYDKYKSIYDSVFDIKSNYFPWMSAELIGLCKSRKALNINIDYYYTFRGGFNSATDSSCVMLGKYNEVESKRISEVTYRGKVVYSKEEAISRFCSSESQVGVIGLNDYLKHGYKLSTYNKDFYDSLPSNLKANYIISDAICGDLVFVNSHFGLIIGEEQVFLDNDMIEDLKDVFVCIKEKELNNNLLEMKDYLVKKYQKIIINKTQKANKAKKA